MAADLVILMGAPGRIRTRDPLLRRQLLYPAELQAPTERIVQYPGHAQATSPGRGHGPGLARPGRRAAWPVVYPGPGVRHDLRCTTRKARDLPGHPAPRSARGG